MNLVSPYKNIIQYARIPIKPHQMNADIRSNIKSTTKTIKEKKCNKNGFIDEVYKILECSDGMMPPENLNGSAISNIKFFCKICIPIENTLIIGQVSVINQELIIVKNGPIIIFIPKDNIDSNYWDIIDGYINKKTNKKLMTEDYVKVQITDKNINQNDTLIKSMGKLNDFATLEEVNKYFGSKIVKNSNSETESIIQDTDTVENSETESNYII